MFNSYVPIENHFYRDHSTGKMNQTLTRALRKGLVLACFWQLVRLCLFLPNLEILVGQKIFLNDVHTGTCY